MGPAESRCPENFFEPIVPPPSTDKHVLCFLIAAYSRDLELELEDNW
jgi:hypothetical protein